MRMRARVLPKQPMSVSERSEVVMLNKCCQCETARYHHPVRCEPYWASRWTRSKAARISRGAMLGPCSLRVRSRVPRDSLLCSAGDVDRCNDEWAQASDDRRIYAPSS